MPRAAVPAALGRAAMLTGAAVTVPAATALVVSMPPGRFTAVGGFIGLAGLLCLRLWWRLRPRPTDLLAAGRATAGAVLTVLVVALSELGLALFLRRSPGDPLGAYAPAIAAGGAAALCLVVRIMVGMRARAQGRRPAVAR